MSAPSWLRNHRLLVARRRRDSAGVDRCLRLALRPPRVPRTGCMGEHSSTDAEPRRRAALLRPANLGSQQDRQPVGQLAHRQRDASFMSEARGSAAPLIRAVSPACRPEDLQLGARRTGSPGNKAARPAIKAGRAGDRAREGRQAYWPCAARAFSICALTASRLKLAPGCMGGNSIAVCATFATSFCTNWKRQNSYTNQL